MEGDVMKNILMILLAIAAAGTVGGCLNDVEEVQLDYSGLEIPAPEGLSASIADSRVDLSWRTVAVASRYRIYRTTLFSEQPTRIAETADTVYTDDGLINGRAYYYSISSMTSDNIEGPRSDAIIAVPSVHSVLINGGLEFTNDRDVVLSLTAPPITSLMMIGGDPDLTGGIWETFSATRSWRLSEGDSSKHVYASFQDEGGAISPVVSDSITLDTHAAILQVSVDAETFSPGGSAHFSMEVEGEETGGDAWIRIGGTSLQIILNDDGGGNYTADYTFPVSIRGTDMTVTGYFVDQAGNEALPPFEMEGTISFTDPPPPVNLIGATDSTVSSITLLWETYSDEHFQSYRLYRASETGVDESTSLLVMTIYNESQASYTDNGLIEGKKYFYRIYVVNDLDETTGSNEVEASTFDAFPDPVVLDSLSAIGDYRLTLTWSRNNNTDFESYRIYRNEDIPGVTLESPSVLIGTITESEITHFDDTGIDNTAHTYYYRIYVYDSSDKYSRSNEMSTEGQ